jgi:hypothetical protein
MRPISRLLLRAYLPAVVVAVLLAVVLRPVGLPHGAKVGACFISYLLVHSILRDRATGVKRSRGAWAGTVALALSAGALMWLIDRA